MLPRPIYVGRDEIVIPASALVAFDDEMSPNVTRILVLGQEQGYVRVFNPDLFWLDYCPGPDEWPGIAWPAKRNGRRIAIPASTRRKVLEAGACAYCRSTQRLEVDHILPVSRGGTNRKSNLQVLCRDCNSIKRARLPGDPGVWGG